MINFLSLSWPLVSMSRRGFDMLRTTPKIKSDNWVESHRGRCTLSPLNCQYHRLQWMNGDLRIRRWKVSLHHRYRWFVAKFYCVIFIIQPLFIIVTDQRENPTDICEAKRQQDIDENVEKKMRRKREGNADALRRRRSTLTEEEKDDARTKNTAARRRHRALLSLDGNASVRAKDIASAVFSCFERCYQMTPYIYLQNQFYIY